MDISKFLSKATGIYLVIVSIAVLINTHQFLVGINNLIHDEPLMLVTGFFTLIPGILMVVSHNIWQWSWRVIITIIAWLVFLKGIFIIMYPKMLDTTTVAFTQDTGIVHATVWVDLIFGLVLCYFGFRRKN